MKNIGFYQPHLDILGTGVSCFDYAYYNEKLLGNKSFFFCDKNHYVTHPDAAKKFKENLEVIELNGELNMNELEIYCKSLNLDAMYIQKCGLKNDGRYVNSVPMFIHVVGCQNDPHGLAYAYVSEWLSEACSNREHPYVPYMVNLPEINENLRHKFNIPNDAIVFGRIGNSGSWNISFVNDAITNFVNSTPNVYFILVNTPKFTTHERILFHEPFADLSYKRKFINTCDAMIHSRFEGESFGAAVAEFSSCNKPVITYSDSSEKNHIFTLKEKGLYYNNYDSLFNIFKTFTPQPDKDWNAYKHFTPENVMQKFKSIFIDKL
jgi:hypothetical protein